MTCGFLTRLSIALSIVLGIGGLPGCVQTPPKPSMEPIFTTTNREKLAVGLQAKDALAEALIQWKILSTIEPYNEFYKNQVDTTTQLIDMKAKFLMREGAASLRRGDRESARLSFLKTLALDPQNREAFAHLQQLEQVSSRAGKNNEKADSQCCGGGRSLSE